MGPEPLSIVVFMALLNVELSMIDDPLLREVANARLIPPRPKTLMYASSRKGTYVAWLFAESSDQKVGAAYCDRGRAYADSQWGLIDLKADYFGHESFWYPSVNDLIASWVRRSSAGWLASNITDEAGG